MDSRLRQTYYIRETTKTTDLQAIQRLRAYVYTHDELEVPDRFYDGKLIDDDDDVAHHFAIYAKHDLIVGAFKMSIRSSHTKMRVEQYFSPNVLMIPAQKKSAELTRLAVEPHFRGLNLPLGLWHAAYLTAVKLGVDYAYAMQRQRGVEIQKKIGLPVEILGKPAEIKGHFYIPTRTHIPDITKVLRQRNARVADYLNTTPINGAFKPVNVFLKLMP